MNEVGRITWQPDGGVQPAYEELSLTVHAMMADRRHPQRCGGHAECGTCRVQVLGGAEHLTPPTAEERELVHAFPEAFRADERLACQCRPLGDVEVTLPRRRLPDLRDAR